MRQHIPLLVVILLVAAAVGYNRYSARQGLSAVTSMEDAAVTEPMGADSVLISREVWPKISDLSAVITDDHYPKPIPDGYYFADIHYGASVKSVAQGMASAGFILLDYQDHHLYFCGDIMQKPACAWALMHPQKGMVKLELIFQINEGRDALYTYHDVLATLEQKYGKPNVTRYEFAYPYKKGDGFEIQAIRSGRGHVFSLWPRKGETSLGIQIDMGGQPRLEYSGEYSIEYELELQKQEESKF